MLKNVSECEAPVVLLIDDDPVSREVTATLLTLEGYTAHGVDSGEAALKMLNEGQHWPDVILSDVRMPGLSGAELLHKLREAVGDASIYVISGSEPPEAVTSVADGVLLKPFDTAALRNMLREQKAQRKDAFSNRGEAVVSTEVVAKLRHVMSEEQVREIYAAVVSDLDRRIKALEAAIARQDWDEVGRIGHAIKGGCGMAGAQQAARVGALLEAEPLKGDNHFDNSRALLADLEAATRSLQRILNNELSA